MNDENAKVVILGFNVLSIRPPIVAILCFAIGYLLHISIPTSINIGSSWTAFILIVLGFLSAAWALFTFSRQKTTIYPTGRPTHLVSEGLFRVTRNPMYLGLALILTGFAFMMGSPQAFVAPILFVAAMNFIYIPFEERRLLGIFGGAYEAYCHRVRRWL